MPLGKCLKLTNILFCIGLPLVTVTWLAEGMLPFLCGCVGLIFLAVAIVLKLIHYRCPHCGELLPLFGALPEYCKMCGRYMKPTDVKKGAKPAR